MPIDNILTTVREFAPARLVFLFGCGGDRDKTKRPEMAQIAVKYATTAILTSDNPRHEDPDAILDDMVAGLAPGDRLPADRRGVRQHCAYCVIPSLRGKYRSRPMEELLEEGSRIKQQLNEQK